MNAIESQISKIEVAKQEILKAERAILEALVLNTETQDFTDLAICKINDALDLIHELKQKL